MGLAPNTHPAIEEALRMAVESGLAENATQAAKLLGVRVRTAQNVLSREPDAEGKQRPRVTVVPEHLTRAFDAPDPVIVNLQQAPLTAPEFAQQATEVAKLATQVEAKAWQIMLLRLNAGAGDAAAKVECERVGISPLVPTAAELQRISKTALELRCRPTMIPGMGKRVLEVATQAAAVAKRLEARGA